MNKYDPMNQLQNLLDTKAPKLEYTKETDHESWRQKAYNKLVEITGYDKFEKVEPEMVIEYKKDREYYYEIRFTMKTEESCEMPCYLLIPKGVDNPQLMICLQGHATSMDNSLGRDRLNREEHRIERDSDFAMQAIKHNMAALCVEQRGMGERKENLDTGAPECHIPTMTELLLGRSIIGARAWDVSRAIDVIETYFTEINADKIYIMGNSGGGSASFYATCLDSRIKGLMPSCSICTYKHSIATIRHCVCNHVPSIREFFEMGDLAGLIAPRPFVITAGREDTIFPLEGTLETYNKVQYIYKKLNSEENCALIIGEGGHYFYPELAWPKFLEIIE